MFCSPLSNLQQQRDDKNTWGRKPRTPKTSFLLGIAYIIPPAPCNQFWQLFSVLKNIYFGQGVPPIQALPKRKGVFFQDSFPQNDTHSRSNERGIEGSSALPQESFQVLPPTCSSRWSNGSPDESRRTLNEIIWNSRITIITCRTIEVWQKQKIYLNIMIKNSRSMCVLASRIMVFMILSSNLLTRVAFPLLWFISQAVLGGCRDGWHHCDVCFCSWLHLSIQSRRFRGKVSDTFIATRPSKT